MASHARALFFAQDVLEKPLVADRWEFYLAQTFSAASTTAGVRVPQLSGCCETPNRSVMPHSTARLLDVSRSRVPSCPLTSGLKTSKRSAFGLWTGRDVCSNAPELVEVLQYTLYTGQLFPSGLGVIVFRCATISRAWRFAAVEVPWRGGGGLTKWMPEGHRSSSTQYCQGVRRRQCAGRPCLPLHPAKGRGKASYRPGLLGSKGEHNNKSIVNSATLPQQASGSNPAYEYTSAAGGIWDACIYSPKQKF